MKEGVNKVEGVNLTEKDVDDVMKVMDSNHNGFIDYTEFIAACLQSYNYLKETHLKAAFTYFDKDGSGTISLDELKACLQSEDFTIDDPTITSLLKEVDINNDGVVDYKEFIDMMKKNSEYSSLLS